MIDVEKGCNTLSAMTVRVGGQLVPRGVEINDENGRQVRLTRCVCNLDRLVGERFGDHFYCWEPSELAQVHCTARSKCFQI